MSTSAEMKNEFRFSSPRSCACHRNLFTTKHLAGAPRPGFQDAKATGENAGRIARSGGPELALELEESGYDELEAALATA